ncbi:MAG: DegV family protein, partial [Oscillospiraceae bacterium]
GDTVKYQQTKEFYDEVRAGAMPKTSQINPEKCECIFKAILNDGFDVLCISFSSALSGTCQTTKLVADRLKDEYPE